MTTALSQFATASQARTPELGERLQQVVLRWKGAERNQQVTDLHADCQTCAGSSAHLLLPDRVLLVRDLDSSSLRAEMSRRRLFRGADDAPRFRVHPTGRFDAVLVPSGPASQTFDRWVMFVEQALSAREQYVLYAHALAHGLLNLKARRLGQTTLPLDPRSGYSHWDRLSELRLLENARQPLDRRVLEAYPQLADLLRAPGELATSVERVDPSLIDRLAAAGWRGSLLTAPFTYTDGRIYAGEDGVRRGRRLRIDGLLRAEASLPIALVHATRPGEDLESAITRLSELNWERFRLPFAFLAKPEGVEELDWTGPDTSPLEWITGGDTLFPARRTLADFPKVDELLSRWLARLNLTDDQARDALRYPYEVRAGQYPRHYQEVAINRAIAAVLQARRGLRNPRVLLTLATGTGKTKVAFQIAWKLKGVRAVKNVMFLTDRDYLLTQAMDNEFAPFRDARARIRGELRTAQDVFFTTYQALAGDLANPLYKKYPKNYFDLVIVDECHRGSAQDESNWRKILTHFDAAVQIGMTATPLRDDNVDTYKYFGKPLVVYSLRQGINDGYLAPYRVRRVLTDSVEAEQEAVESASDSLTPELPPASSETSDEEPTGDGEEEMVIRLESSSAMVARTDLIASHLARTLRETDPKAKTIVFCVDQSHAESMRKALEKEFTTEIESFKERGENFLERIVSDEGADGKRALGKFSDPEKDAPVIVTTSRLLSTGVDIPPVKNIVIARPIGSIVEFKQIVGRGTRLDEPRKMWFTIIDYAGTTRHFFDPDFDGDPQGVDLDQLDPTPPAEGGEAPADTVATEDRPVTPQAGDETVSNGLPTDPVAPAVLDGFVPSETVPAALVATVDSAPGAEGMTSTQVVPTSETVEPGALDSGPAVQPGGTVPAVDATPIAPVQPEVAVNGEPVVHAVSDSISTDIAQPSAAGTTTNPSTPIPGAERRTRPRDGGRIAVVGETLYELGPDGRTLREIPYLEYAREAIGDDVPDVEGLRQRWLRPELRSEMEARLADAGVELPELAAVFNLGECDAFDVVAHALFRQPVPTRRDRVERLRERHADWLTGFSSDAREILDALIMKYLEGEADDLTDTGLLKVPPLSDRGTFMELAQRFVGGGQALREALAELQRRLYQP